MPADETIELIGYCFGFWLFIFSQSFRQKWLSKVKNGDAVDRFFAILEAVTSISAGVVAPIWLVSYLL